MQHGHGHWRLVASIAPARSKPRWRRRARATSLLSCSVLALLGAAVGLIAVSARRAHALARQQIEFVAAVSHELRTPVSVIGAAAGNLADGVVGDPARVKQYGATIQTEARRLGETVERVLQFAGLGCGPAAAAWRRCRPPMSCARPLQRTRARRRPRRRRRRGRDRRRCCRRWCRRCGRAALGAAEPDRQRGEVRAAPIALGAGPRRAPAPPPAPKCTSPSTIAASASTPTIAATSSSRSIAAREALSQPDPGQRARAQPRAPHRRGPRRPGRP